MDEQNSPSTEPITTTADPAGNHPISESQTTESAQAPVEPVSAPETAQAESPTEPISETGTAQMAGSEPLPASTPEPTPSAGASAETPQQETPTPAQGSTSQPEPTPTPVPASMPAQAQVTTTSPRTLARLFLEKAKAVIQLRKQKKLLKIMTLFEKKNHITNDEVEKLLHVSDATATRYLSELEKQRKITQTGKTGHAVSYTKK
jgi:hypothetical protein